MGKKKNQMTNEEFLKDFEEFQNNWQQEVSPIFLRNIDFVWTFPERRLDGRSFDHNFIYRVTCTQEKGCKAFKFKYFRGFSSKGRKVVKETWELEAISIYEETNRRSKCLEASEEKARYGGITRHFQDWARTTVLQHQARCCWNSAQGRIGGIRIIEGEVFRETKKAIR